MVSGWTPGSKDGADPPPSHAADEMSGNEQLRLHLDSARQMDKAGNDEAALGEYERVLQLDRNNFTAMRRLCVLYDRRGSRDDFKKAEDLYQKIAKLHPKDADIWNDWGYSLYLRTEKEHNTENWLEAEKKLRHALELNPQHDRAHENLGLVLGGLDRYPEALGEFRAAHLSESEAHVNMAFIYITKWKLEDAKQECRIARDKDPSNSKALDLLTALDQPPRSRDKMVGGKRKALTPDEEEQEHEAARREVAARFGNIAALADDKGGAGQPITGPIRAGGQMWMPVSPKASTLPVLLAPVPPAAPTTTLPPPVPPAGSGTTGTISF